MSNSTRESRQRKFIRDVFPYHGQHLAQHMAGFTPPSIDGQVEELKESFKLWQAVSATGADDTIMESSWWMSRLVDPYNRASMAETLANNTQLAAFAVGVLGQLLDTGKIKWADDDLELPPISVEMVDGMKLGGDSLSEDDMLDVARLLEQLDDMEDDS